MVAAGSFAMEVDPHAENHAERDVTVTVSSVATARLVEQQQQMLNAQHQLLLRLATPAADAGSHDSQTRAVKRSRFDDESEESSADEMKEEELEYYRNLLKRRLKAQEESGDKQLLAKMRQRDEDGISKLQERLKVLKNRNGLEEEAKTEAAVSAGQDDWSGKGKGTGKGAGKGAGKGGKCRNWRR